LRQVRLSTNCSARAEFADFAPRFEFVRIQNADAKCQPIQLSKNLAPDQIGTSHSRWGVHTALQRHKAIKNPASSAGLSRPHTAGRFCAMLDYCLTCVRNRPHFRVEIRESLIAPDNHSYSPDESKVYQNLLIRQGVVFKIVQKLWISCCKWASGVPKNLRPLPPASPSQPHPTTSSSWRLRHRRFDPPHCRPDRSSCHRPLRGPRAPCRRS